MALPGDYVLYGRGDVLWFPQPSCAPVWRAHRFRFGSSRLIRVKAAARVNLEIMHDSLWLSLGFHNRVHGIASHAGREQFQPR